MSPILAAVTMLAVASPALQVQKPETPFLTVSATSEVMSEPDEAVVRLGVVAQAPTAKEAQEKANAVTTRFVAEATKLGIARKNLQTSRITLSPVWSNRPNQTPQIESYQATNTLSATITDFALIGRVIDAGVAAGANNLEGVSFSVKSKEPMLDALAEAVREAARKADVMANALGMELAGVLEVSEGGSLPAPMMWQGAAKMDAALGTPIEPGQISVGATVTVRYALRAKR